MNVLIGVLLGIHKVCNLFDMIESVKYCKRVTHTHEYHFKIKRYFTCLKLVILDNNFTG